MSGLIEKIKSKAEGGSGLTQGSKIPNTGLLKEDSVEKGSVDLTKLRGKNLIVAVPGAFSSTCSNQVPGYVEHAEQFVKKGIEGIYVVAVNDVFVMKAWKKDLDADSNPLFHFIADDDASFAKKVGMSFDGTALLGNHRSLRYVALVENGSVEKIWVEDSPTDLNKTKADSVLGGL